MADERKSAGEIRPADPESTRTSSSPSSIDRTLVARRAYERYRQRGEEHGRDQQDWYEAERELIAAQHEEE